MEVLQRIYSWMPHLLSGAWITVSLTVLSVSAGFIFGIFLAIGKISKNVLISKICSAYIFIFRGTPLLMQLFFIYYALPKIIPVFTINSRFLAAFTAFSLNCAAYCAEIIRAAIQSIDKEQYDAGRVLGLSRMQTMLHVIFPQAIKRLIPPIGNEFIMMLKDVSLVSMIALVDITRAMRSIENSTGSALVYIPALILYLIITAIFTYIFRKLEKKYSQGL
ncbi:MAG: amino acid ABC transporter permease [Treponema sp.]|nr:amino acid ABC transporter permease [Treponema sp.]